MDNTKYKCEIYTIYDNKAGDLMGPLHTHKHEAAAIRFYTDIATLKDSAIGKHPADYDLVRLGYLTIDNHLEDNFEVILTGAAWAATQQEP